jgi:hypothetical protein
MGLQGREEERWLRWGSQGSWGSKKPALSSPKTVQKKWTLPLEGGLGVAGQGGGEGIR